MFYVWKDGALWKLQKGHFVIFTDDMKDQIVFFSGTKQDPDQIFGMVS